jgi:hypothetical protein
MASHPLLAEIDGVHSFLVAAANTSASSAAVAAQHAAMLAKLRLAGHLPLLVAAELLTKAFRKIHVLLRFSDRCIHRPTCGSLIAVSPPTCGSLIAVFPKCCPIQAEPKRLYRSLCLHQVQTGPWPHELKDSLASAIISAAAAGSYTVQGMYCKN